MLEDITHAPRGSQSAHRPQVALPEKRTIGALWERESGGLFIVVEKKVGDKDMRAQLIDKTGAA